MTSNRTLTDQLVDAEQACARIRQSLDAGDTVGLLRQAAALADAARDVLAAAVHQARGRGATWRHVGHALGVTRQSAQQRFAPTRPDAAAEPATPGPPPPAAAHLPLG